MAKHRAPSNQLSLFDDPLESQDEEIQLEKGIDNESTDQLRGALPSTGQVREAGSGLLDDLPPQSPSEAGGSREVLPGDRPTSLRHGGLHNDRYEREDREGRGDGLHEAAGPDQYGPSPGRGNDAGGANLYRQGAGDRGQRDASSSASPTTPDIWNSTESLEVGHTGDSDELTAPVNLVFPTGKRAKLKANLEALECLKRLRARDGQLPTPQELDVLRRYSSFGSIPEVFDETRHEFDQDRAHLETLLDPEALAAARRTTLNAHFTDPQYISAMWEAARGLGFGGGRVLEPGCGTGLFLAAAPDGCELVGVELDPTTAQIAQLLNPGARIFSESFAKSTFSDNSFDLVIGNVPFGSFSLFDPTHNPNRHSIHNHFLIKSLDLLRPGGILLVISSRYTLDSHNSLAREDIAQRGGFLGAVRLPTAAHRRHAGTEVVTDVIVVRKHVAPVSSSDQEFVSTTEIDLDGQNVRINDYFLSHPQRVLGSLVAGRGEFGAPALEVQGDLSTVTRDLSTQLSSIVSVAPAPEADGRVEVAGELGESPLAVQSTSDHRNKPFEVGEMLADVALAPHMIEGSYGCVNGIFFRIKDGRPEVIDTPSPSAAGELRSLIDLRDLYLSLLDCQSRGSADSSFEDLQGAFTTKYDLYVAKYGPVSRYKLARTGRIDPDSGEEIMRRVNPSLGGFRQDAWFQSLAGIEDFDVESQSARKGPIFFRRILSQSQTLTHVGHPEDALALSLDKFGHVSLDYIAKLLSVTPDEARAQLGTLVFEDPTTGTLHTHEEYLSGHVVDKLREAQDATARDPRFEVNVQALLAVQPVRVEAGDIDARLGASWLDPRDIAQFAQEVLGASILVEHVGGAMWKLGVPTYARYSVVATSTYGTDHYDAFALLEASLTQRAVRVYIEVDGRKVVDLQATLAAQAKQDELQDKFSQWLWQDPQRSDRLVNTYNKLFNSTRLRHFDGSHLTLPGISNAVSPFTYQRSAVWRVLCAPTSLLAHPVGAGKTLEMVIAGHELRRLGLVRLPAYVVPNHMLDQFSSEYAQLYPGVPLLVADKDRTGPAQRRAFAAQCASGDFDAVIMTHSSFSRLAIDPEIEAAYLHREIDRITDAIAVSKEGRGLLVKQLERARIRAEERLERQLSRIASDEGLTFEQTGIDFVFVDEAHLYKNLRVDSRLQGLSCTGSVRSQQLDMALFSLRQRNSDRIACFATGTPVANSIAELHTMMRYLCPDVLEAANVADVDAWAATFTRSVAEIELSPEGGSLRMVERIARYANVPELLTMFYTVADLLPPGTLDANRPSLEGGKPTIISVEPSAQQSEYMAALVERARMVRNKIVEPSVDNMLKISSDGRRAALDIRLVGGVSDGGNKVVAAAANIARIFEETRNYTYGDDDDHTGALQIVFCDVGTPHPHQWSVYSELRSQLVSRGIPYDQVAFVHDAKSDQAKADLFAACRDGKIAVLVGSTEKMGVGTNVQQRAIALHHLDCPWRPADVEQREGRILRQGNENTSVSIYRYATVGSFDVYMWQTVERKAKFISQLMTGELTQRECEDIGASVLSYGEVKALASGNPLVLEQAEVDAQVSRLSGLRRSHDGEQRRLTRFIADSGDHAASLETTLKALDQAIMNRVETSGDSFVMELGGQHFPSRVEAGAALVTTLQELSAHPTLESKAGIPIGTVAGFPIRARLLQIDTTHNAVDVSLQGVPTGVVSVNFNTDDPDPVGLIKRVCNLATSLETVRKETHNSLTSLNDEIGRARHNLDRSFPQQEALDAALARHRELATLMQLEASRESVTNDDVANEHIIASPGPVRPPSVSL